MAEIEKTRKQIRLEKETVEREKYNDLKKQSVQQEKQEQETGTSPLFDNQFVVTHFTSLFVQFLYENGFTPQEVEAMFGVYVGTDTNKKTEKFDKAFALQQQQSGDKKNQVTSVLLNKIKQLEDKVNSFQDQQARITALETKTSTIEGQITTLQSQVSSNSSDINNNKNDIDNLTSAVASLTSIVSSLSTP